MISKLKKKKTNHPSQTKILKRNKIKALKINNSSIDIISVASINKKYQKSWFNRIINLLWVITVFYSFKSLISTVSAQSINRNTILDQSNTDQLKSKFIIRLRTLQDTLLVCGQPLLSMGSKPCSKIVETTPIIWTVSVFNSISNSVDLQSAVQFGDSSSEIIYFLVKDDKKLLRYQLPSQTSLLITYPISNFFNIVEKSKIPNQNLILLTAFDNPVTPLSHTMHLIDILNDSSIQNFPNINQNIHFLDSGHSISSVIFVDTESNANDFIYDFDYTSLSSTSRSFDSGQATSNTLAQVRFSTDDVNYFLTSNVLGTVSFMRAYRFNDHNLQSELELVQRPYSLQTFPYSKYLVVGLRGPPSMTSKLNFVDYRDPAAMIFVSTDPDDKFEATFSNYYDLNLQQVGNRYEIYFTNGDQQIKMFGLVYELAQNCHGTCLTCRDFDERNTACLTCRSDFIFESSNNTCRCQEGYSQLLGPLSSCQACDTGCKTCSSTMTTCTSCIAPYVHDGGSSTCICPLTTHEINDEGACVVLGPEPDTSDTSNDGDIIEKSISLKSKYFDSVTQEITLKFDTKISVKKFTSNPSSYTITLTNSSKETKILKLIKYKILKKKKRILIFKLDLGLLSIRNEKISILSQFNNPTSIINPNITFSKFPIEISPINHYSTNSDPIIKKFFRWFYFTLNILFAILIITTSQNYVSLAKLLQMIDFLHLLNVQIPNNVEIFYDSMKGDFIEFIPNPFYNRAVLECELHRKVENAGFECLLANNNGQIILVIFSFLGFKLLIGIIRLFVRGVIMAFCRKKSTSVQGLNGQSDKQGKTVLKNFTSILDSYFFRLFSWKNFLNLLISLQIDILISICIYLQAKYYSGDWFLRNEKGEIQDRLSMALSLIYIITYSVISIGMIIGQLQFLRIS